MREPLIIKARNSDFREDGKVKQLTKNCIACRWYREFDGIRYCGVGSSYSILFDCSGRADKTACTSQRKAPIGATSAFYIDLEIRRLEEYQKSICG